MECCKNNTKSISGRNLWRVSKKRERKSWAKPIRACPSCAGRRWNSGNRINEHDMIRFEKFLCGSHIHESQLTHIFIACSRWMMANTFKHYLKIPYFYFYVQENFGVLLEPILLDQVRLKVKHWACVYDRTKIIFFNMNLYIYCMHSKHFSSKFLFHFLDIEILLINESVS